MRQTLVVLVVLSSCTTSPCNDECSKSQVCSTATNTCVDRPVVPTRDSGVIVSDAGVLDSGVATSTDSGVTVDAGRTDAGRTDAGPVPDAGVVTVGDDIGAGRFKVLFDNTKAEQAGNADWVIDESGQTPSPANPSVESDWLGGYSAWGVALAKSGNFELQTLTKPNTITFGNAGNPQDLVHFHAFVLPEPNIALSPAEMTAVVEYVRAGGGLFYIGDHGNSDRNGDGVDSVLVMNRLATAKGNPFGITLAGDNFFSSSIHNVVTDPTLVILHGPFGEVAKTSFYNGSTLIIDPFANPTARAVFWKNSVNGGNTNVLMATAKFGKGRVVVFGDSSAADDGTGRAGAALQDGWSDSQANNSALFPNATLWAADQRCTNGKLDPTEADVDCGQRCGGCSGGLKCTGNADCYSGTCTSGTCTGLTVERVDAPCRAPSLGLDASGQPQVSYARDGVVGFASRASGAWALSTIAAPTAIGVEPRLAVDDGNHSHVLWADSPSVVHATQNGATWSTVTVGSYQYVNSVELDSKKRLNALLKSTACSIEHAVLVGSSWVVTPIEPGVSSCGYESLALDQAATPFVAYSVTVLQPPSTTPRYAVLDGGTWAIERPPFNGLPAAIALDPGGRPHLVMLDKTVDHVWKSDAGWKIEAIADAGQVSSASMLLGPGGSLLAVYDQYDSAGSTVFLARQTASGWVVTAVGRGSKPSMALNAAGEPTIASCSSAPPYTLFVAH